MNSSGMKASGDGQSPRIRSNPTHIERTAPAERNRLLLNSGTRYPVIEVGDSRFVVKSQDRLLIRELRLFCETLRGDPRAEVRFTNKLLTCTEEGRLQPWGWQRQSCRTG